MSNTLFKQHLLTDIDVEILRFLAKNIEATPSEISSAINKPRTTIAFRLNKLKKRDLCLYKKHKNLSIWSLTKAGSEILIKRKQVSNEIDINEGIEYIQDSMQNLASSYQAHRIYLFEPSEQTRLFVQKSNENKFQKTNELIKKFDLIVEVLIGEKTLNYAKNLTTESRESMFGRPTIAYQLPDAVLNFNQIIMCFMEDIYFIDYGEEKVIHIKNKEVTQSYRKVFEQYKVFGKRVDFNSEIKNRAVAPSLT